MLPRETSAAIPTSEPMCNYCVGTKLDSSLESCRPDMLRPSRCDRDTTKLCMRHGGEEFSICNHAHAHEVVGATHCHQGLHRADNTLCGYIARYVRKHSGSFVDELMTDGVATYMCAAMNMHVTAEGACHGIACVWLNDQALTHDHSCRRRTRIRGAVGLHKPYRA